MPLIAALTNFIPATYIIAAEVNGNFTAIRNAFNSSAVLTDVARTISAHHTFTSGFDVTGGGIIVSDDVVADLLQAERVRLLNAEAPSSQDWQLQAADNGELHIVEIVSGKTVAVLRDDGTLVLGTDPGGAALLRVGGGMRVSGPTTLAGAVALSSTLLVQGAATFDDGVAIEGAGVVASADHGASGAAKTVDWAASNTAKLTVDQNTTLTFDGAAEDQWCSLRIRWGGAYNITWPASVIWAGGSAPTFTRTNGRVDWVSFFYNGSEYEAFPSGFNFASSV